MKRITTGYVMVPGFRPADVVGTQAVLGPHPLDKSVYVAPSLTPVEGRSGMTLVPNATFDDCPELDALVVGDIPDVALDDERLIDFLLARIPDAQFVIGVSAGVEALVRTGLMKGREATTDRTHLDRLLDYGVCPRAEVGRVVDGSFVTAGPSTGMIEAAYLVQERMRGKGFAKFLELNLEYDPKCQFASAPTGGVASQSFSGLKGLKVAAVVPDLVYLPDIMGAVDVLGSLPGTEVFFVSDSLKLSRGLLSLSVVPDTTYDNCPDVDVVLVGATGPQALSDKKLLDFIRYQDKNAQAMISVCAGSLIFGAAGLLEGKRATSNFHHTSLLRKFGATPSQNAVERDGKYFSAGPAIGSYEIALQVVAEIYGPEIAHELEQNVLEFSPNPIFGIGSPEKAGGFLKFVSQALIAPTRPIYSVAGQLGRKRLTS